MSVCAVLLVKDEADVIEPVLRHLREQVDYVLVSDNGSTDGTKDILRDFCFEAPLAWLDVYDDEDPAYYQSRKTTSLAMRALERGHTWVVPCDADEVWHVNDTERTLSEFLAGLAPDIQIVTAQLFHHIPSALDLPATPPHTGAIRGEEYEPNPARRIGYRKREHAGLPKVACRLRPDLVIHAGNHGASTDGTALRSGGLSVRHFSWRSREQYLRKIRNGERAYAATDLPEDTGLHWRMWADHSDEAVMDHFDTWYYSRDPGGDPDLIYDPAPVSGP